MGESIIQVEGVSKSYWLKHQAMARGGARYERFSEVLMNAVKAPFRRNKNSEETSATREEFWALRDISFEIKQGEVVGIIGRNGAGKSTLLKILSRITEPSSGRVVIDGRVASLLEVGTGFHPELTGRENIFLNGAVLGMSRVEIKRKFDEIVAFAEVEKFLDTPVKRYSSGMYVRLAFAVAAHLEPEILIVDEVLAVGDARFQKKCLGKMRDISQNEGRTVLFVSHNLDSILRLTTRTIWLDAGRMRLDGPPAQVISAYHENAHDAAPLISLRDRERLPVCLRNIELAFVEFAGASTSKPWVYGFGEELKFHCHLHIHRQFTNSLVGYAIFNSTGTEIASTHSPVHLASSPDAGGCVVELALPGLRLAPGSYSLNLAVYSDAGVEDYVENTARFDVITNPLAADSRADTIRAAVIPVAYIKVIRSLSAKN